MNEIQQHLQPGEEVLWRGRLESWLPPDLTATLFYAAMSALPFVMAVVLGRDKPEIDEAWWRISWIGVPFLVLGLYMSIGQVVRGILQTRAVRYAVTDRRVFILRGWPSSRVTGYGLDTISEVALQEVRDGRGTVRFRSGRKGATVITLEQIGPTIGAATVARLIGQG